MPFNPSLIFFIGPKSDHCFVLSVIESLTAFCEPCSRFVKSYFLERCDQFRVVFGGVVFFLRWILLEVLDQQADGTRLVVGHFIGNAPLARLPEINFDQKYFPPFGCFHKEVIIRFTTRIRYQNQPLTKWNWTLLKKVSCYLKSCSQKSHHPTFCCPKSHLQSDLCRKSAIAGRRILSDPVVCEFLVVESYHQGSRIEMVYYPTPSSGNANSNYVLAFYSNGKKYVHENWTWPSTPHFTKPTKNKSMSSLYMMTCLQTINKSSIICSFIVLYVWVSQIC